MGGVAHARSVDSHIQLDPFAVHRHADIRDLRVKEQEHASELKAEEAGLFYIKLGPADNERGERGNIACFGYGAGLAMATADALLLKGGSPANFLDGGASPLGRTGLIAQAAVPTSRTLG